MASFFIDRPIFAWVIALFISILGAVAITKLPVAQYPTVAPPSIVITAGYPGASTQTLEDSVLSVIEREMNGSPGLIYMESVAQANGSGIMTIEVRHMLRAAVAISAAVTLDKPTALYVRTESNLAMPRQPGRVQPGFAVEFVEVPA